MTHYGFVMTDELLKPFYGQYEYFFTENQGIENSLSQDYFDELYKNQNDPWNFRHSEYEHKKYKNSVEALGKQRFKIGLELGCSVGVQTKLLAEICQKLVAVDISSVAVDEAKKTCENLTNIDFRVADVSEQFPIDNYDLITLCEIGYYFNKESLQMVFENVNKTINKNGKFLMVHWTGFVPDYPLTGNEVHEIFNNYNSQINEFEKLVSESHDLYRMEVWNKI